MWKRPTVTLLLVAVCFYVGCQTSRQKVVPQVYTYHGPQTNSSVTWINPPGLAARSSAAIVRPPANPLHAYLKYRVPDSTPHWVMSSLDGVHWQTNWPIATNVGYTLDARDLDGATNAAKFWRVR